MDRGSLAGVESIPRKLDGFDIAAQPRPTMKGVTDELED
jgi:hypothetical protein